MNKLTLKRLVAPVLWLGVGALWLLNLSIAHAQTLPDKVVLDKFPIFAQWYNLSCEYSATRMITAFYGREINDTEFVSLVPFHPNPHVGFRGNINGYFGGTGDYGIYAEPIAKALEERGFKTKLLANNIQGLKQELALGRPVQVWVIAGMGWGSPYTANYEGLQFKLTGGEHSIVIYGYDTQGVYVADPGYGTQDYYYWSDFMRSWSYFDYMAMSVWLPNNSDSGQMESTPGISPLFYRFWLNQGGLSVFGLPISDTSLINSRFQQYFERSRLEYNISRPYNQTIGIGLLGQELTANRQGELPFQAVSPPSTSDALYFEATEHTLTGSFRTLWEKNGGTSLFGYPISEPFLENGKAVQYFERARFEFDSAAPPQYQTELGRLGVEYLNRPRLVPATDEGV